MRTRLEGLPPLVLAAECDQLKERLASVACGEAFLLQGGDCAETFAGTTAETIRGKFRAVPVNEPERYQVPLVGTAYRFRAGHRLRLILTSDDQDAKFPAMMTFRHASVGTSSLNRIASSSRLVLPTPP